MSHRIIFDSVFCGLFACFLVAAVLLRSRLRQPKSLLFLVLIFEMFGFGMRIAYDTYASRWARRLEVDYGPSSYMITMGGACFVALLAGILRGQHSLTEDCKIHKISTRPRSLLVLDVLVFVSSLCILLGFVSFFRTNGYATIAGPIFILVGLGGDLLALILIAISTFRCHIRSWRTRSERQTISGFYRRFYTFWRTCPWTVVVLYVVTIITFVRTVIRSVYYVWYLLWKLGDLHYYYTGGSSPFECPSPEEYVPIGDGFLMLLSIAVILMLRPILVASNTTARGEVTGAAPPVNRDSGYPPQNQILVEKV
ncbi:hypothetical protein CC79DRAFT_1397221 [Sarocladium strictum]